MSDRVARLAELRRKRDRTESGKEDADITATIDVSKRSTTQEAAEPVRLDDPKLEPEDSEDNSEEAQAAAVRDDIGTTESSGDASIQIGDGEELVLAPRHAYNSDLKEDLAVYLNRAHADTQTAIKKHMQREYRKHIEQVET